MSFGFNQDRLKGARKKQVLIDRNETGVKVKVARLSTELRRALGIKGALPEKAKWSIYHAAQLMEKIGSDDSQKLVDTWYRNVPGADRYIYSDRASKFYYWLRDSRLEYEDSLVMEVYSLLATEYVGRLELQEKAFKEKGLVLLSRIAEWLSDNCGNELEDCLIDYLQAVFIEVKKYKPALIHNPAAILGDYGWSIFMAWIDKEFGGRKGYLLPTKQELRIANRQQQTLDDVTDLRHQALLAGNIELYDKLGGCGINKEEIKQLINSLIIT
jgi:hypothetical protein